MRRSLLALVTFAVCAVSAAAAAGDAGVDALLIQSRAALGGDAALRVRAFHIQSDIVTLGIKGSQDQWQDLAASTYAESQDAGPVSGADGFDGRDAWVRDASGIVHVEGGTQARLQAIDQAYLNGYALWTSDRGGATVEAGGEKTSDGVAYRILRVTPRKGSPMDVWFDDRSALPRRIVATLGTHTFTTTMDDYRRVQGALVPYHVHSESDTGNAVDARASVVEVNPPGIAEHVRKPETNVHDFSIDGGATSTSVPMDIVDNHVYVDVMLDGKGPYRFVFDSGGSNLVDPGVLRELGGSAQGSAQGAGVGAQTEGIAFAKIATLQIGSARLTDQNFAVLPTRAGFGVGAGVPVDGLIGYEVLARFVTTNDYEHRRVVLRLPSDAGTPSGTAIPFVFHDNTPQIRAGIDGIIGDMTVDTGSRVAISVFKPFVDAHPTVAPQVLTAQGVGGFGIGGPALGRLGRIRSLSIGPFLISNSIGDFSSQEKGAFADPYVAANVGGAVWRRFTVTFDYPRQTLYLAPNASFSKPENYDRSGVFLVHRDDKLVVYAVRAGTPAAALGIAKGDVVSSIGGRATAGMSLASVRDAFSGPAGTRLRLGITSGTTTKVVELTLRDYV